MKKFIRATCVWWKGRSKRSRNSVTIILVIVAIAVIYNVKCFIPEFNRISMVSDNDSLAVYAFYDKRGYINVKNGDVVISAWRNDYQKAWPFSEGLAAVMKDGKIGFINARNEVVIPFEFDYCHMWHRIYRCCKFEGGYCIMPNKDNKVGLIDTEGRWVIEPVFNEIWPMYEKSGYRIVVKDRMYGVYDSLFNVVYPTEYDFIVISSDCFILVKDGKKWQVDMNGNIVQPFLYDRSEILDIPVGYGDYGEMRYELSDYAKYEIEGSFGIMNRIIGRPVTPAIYANVRMLSKELFEVQDANDYNWYVVDTDGNVTNKSVDGK